MACRAEPPVSSTMSRGMIATYIGLAPSAEIRSRSASACESEIDGSASGST